MRESNMKVRGRRDAQRGVALFLAVFGLLLLSAIAIAMLFSSDTETTISVNYRDKQAAIFGVLAGLQEARDRIHPLTGDLGPGTNLSSGGLNIVPTALPSSTVSKRGDLNSIEVGWISRKHTGGDVIIWSQGPGSQKLGKALDNTDVYKVMISVFK